MLNVIRVPRIELCGRTDFQNMFLLKALHNPNMKVFVIFKGIILTKISYEADTTSARTKLILLLKAQEGKQFVLTQNI